MNKTFKRLVSRRRQSNETINDDDDYCSNAVLSGNNSKFSNNDKTIVPADRTESDDLLRDWVKRARKFQQSNYNMLGDREWDLIECEEMLKQKIGFALFEIPTDSNYNDEQIKCINSVADHIVKLHENIDETETDFAPHTVYFACIFVHLYFKARDENENLDVLFRIPNKKLSCYMFVDGNCRTYSSWYDYLRKNKLPKCYMCYPLNGKYSADNGSVKIEFKESPACNVINSVLTGLDVTSTVLTVGAAGINIAALGIPIAAPFILGATATMLTSGAYDIGRSVSRLVDRKGHHESLSLRNAESRRAWISIAASATGIASIGSTTIARGVMKGERVLSRGGAMALRLINVSSLAVNSVGIVNSLVTIVIKYLNGTLSRNDVLHFKWACLFFLHVVISYKLANRLIQDAATCDTENLFQTTKNCVYYVTKSAIEFSDSSSYLILRSLVFGTQSIVPNIDLPKIELKALKLLQLVDKYLKGNINLLKFTIDMSEELEGIWLKFKVKIIKCVNELRLLLRKITWKSYILKSSYKQFVESSPDIAWQFCMTIHGTIAHCNLDDKNTEYLCDILSLIRDFSNICPVGNCADFLDKSKYICSYFEKYFDYVRESYELELDSVNFCLTDKKEINADLHSFNEIHGGERDRNVYLFKKALKEIDIKSALELESCDCYRKPEPAYINTATSSHYFFNGPNNESLTRQQYWEKANDITGLDLNDDNSILLLQNNIAMIKPTNIINGINAVVFYNSFEFDCVMGIVTVLQSTCDESFD